MVPTRNVITKNTEDFEFLVKRHFSQQLHASKRVKKKEKKKGINEDQSYGRRTDTPKTVENKKTDNRQRQPAKLQETSRKQQGGKVARMGEHAQ